MKRFCLWKLIVTGAGVIKRHANELMSELERSPFFKGGLVRLSSPASRQEGKEKQCTITEVDAPTSKEQVDKLMLQVDNCQHHRYLQKDGAEGRTFCVKLLSADDARLDIINAIKTLSQNGTKPAEINVDYFQKALAGLPLHHHTVICHLTMSLFFCIRLERSSRPELDTQVRWHFGNARVSSVAACPYRDTVRFCLCP